MAPPSSGPSLLQVFSPKQNDYVYYDRFYGRSVTADTALSGEEQRGGVEHWVWPVRVQIPPYLGVGREEVGRSQ